jgi:hypothetical protein
MTPIQALESKLKAQEIDRSNNRMYGKGITQSIPHAKQTRGPNNPNLGMAKVNYGKFTCGSRSAVIMWSKPPVRGGYHLPTAKQRLTQDELSALVSREMQTWCVKHDDGTTLYSGTRLDCDRWMEGKIKAYERTEGRLGWSPDVIALLRSTQE